MAWRTVGPGSLRARRFFFESSSRSTSLLEHDPRIEHQDAFPTNRRSERAPRDKQNLWAAILQRLCAITAAQRAPASIPRSAHAWRAARACRSGAGVPPVAVERQPRRLAADAVGGTLRDVDMLDDHELPCAGHHFEPLH